MTCAPSSGSPSLSRTVPEITAEGVSLKLRPFRDCPFSSRTRRSEEHTSELQSRQYLHSSPTRRSSALKRLPVAVAHGPGDHGGGRQLEVEAVQRLPLFEPHQGAVAVGPARAVRHFEVAVPVPDETVAPRIEIHQRKASLRIGFRDRHRCGLAIEGLESQVDLVQRFACDGVDHCPGKGTLFRWLVLPRKEKRENEQWRHTILQQQGSSRPLCRAGLI